MEKHNLFHILQSGFRPKHPCHAALSAMCDMWLSAIDHPETVGAVFLDFKKAFDLVDSTILQRKLRVYLNNSSVVPFFQSYLSDRSQYVCANGKLSAVGTINSGVLKAVFSDHCFFVYLYMIYHCTYKTKSKKLSVSDNSSFDTSGKTVKEIEVTLQKNINEVFDWCKNNLMCLHTEKKVHGHSYPSKTQTIPSSSQT